MRHKLLTVLATGVMTMLMSTVAFASSKPNDIYVGNKLIAGDGIPSGYYCLYNSKDTAYASFSIKDGTYLLANDSFKYNHVIYLDDDDVLYMSGCYAVPYDEARIITVDECMFKVGDQIKAGEYVVSFMRGSSGTATCTIWDTLDFHSELDDDGKEVEFDEDVHKISNGSSTKIKLEDDDWVMLSGCRITGAEDKENED